MVLFERRRYWYIIDRRKRRQKVRYLRHRTIERREIKDENLKCLMGIPLTKGLREPFDEPGLDNTTGMMNHV